MTSSRAACYMINCQWTPEEAGPVVDAASKRYIAKNNIRLYTINAIDLAQSIGMGKRANTILQSAFFSWQGPAERGRHQYMKGKSRSPTPRRAWTSSR